tara:strand:+ start:103 stop:459 length:357 start_codon:yes stop_codon:yes gene_type:complete
MEYLPNSKEMLCRLYAIICTADDEYSHPEHAILKDIMKGYGLDYNRVNQLYIDLRENYAQEFDKAVDDTLSSITIKELQKEAALNVKKLSMSDDILHEKESEILRKIRDCWDIDISQL